MKKIFFALALLAVTGSAAFAQQQRYCVIDSRYILERIPDYEKAQQQLDALSANWEKEVDAKFQQIDQMYKSYQAERPMLSESMRQQREEEIVSREKEAKELQRKYFGFEGELFKQRQSLVKPIQDRVYNAVQQYAQSRGYDMIYDKAAGGAVFYADPKLDKSDDIVKLVPGAK